MICTYFHDNFIIFHLAPFSLTSNTIFCSRIFHFRFMNFYVLCVCVCLRIRFNNDDDNNNNNSNSTGIERLRRRADCQEDSGYVLSRNKNVK